MPRLAPQTVFSALNTCIAAMLALYIAFALDLPRPYWAMMTVFITISPSAGAVRSKAVYRIIGTLIGATVTVVLVPNLDNEPLLLSFALALWVGGCLTISLLDRTPRSYGLLLAGYTVALTGFPAVSQPGAMFDIAVARVEEIGLGILCAALMHGLVFPRSMGDGLAAQISRWLAAADGWLLNIAEGAAGSEALRDRQALAAAASDIRIQATHLPFDTSRLRDRQTAVQALHERMLGLIPMLSAAADRRDALAGRRLPRVATERLDEVAAWIRTGSTHDASRNLVAGLRATAAAQAPGGWSELLVESLLTQLADAVVAVAECHTLLAYVRTPGASVPPSIATVLSAAAARPLSSDIGLAVRSGVVCVVAMMAVCFLWIGTRWPDGATAASLVAVFCTLFATQDDPAPPIRVFTTISVLSNIVAALYIFGIFQAIDGFTMLAVVLLPPLFLIAVLMANPKTAPLGSPAAITFASALLLQSSLRADFAAFLNGNLAIYVASFVAVALNREIRSMSAEAAARRLLRLTRTAIARHAGGGLGAAPLDLAAVLVDRLAMLAPRLRQNERGAETAETALRDLRVAMNLSALRRIRPRLGGKARASVDRLTEGLAGHYGRLARGGATEAAHGLLPELDLALAQIAPLADLPDRQAAINLVGLRRNLFPAAAPFVPTMEQPA
jgi:uncharacterized membrane protein YccC